ncbi:MAG: BlaI/MecI/CopY family transcriptional regulator, partial [Candidatus Kapaibacteriota bacterium]
MIITRTVWNNPSPGYLFLAPMDSRDLSVYDNSGFKVYSQNFGFLSQGFVDFKTFGRQHEYFPVISKENYSGKSIKSLVKNYFEGSYTNA